MSNANVGVGAQDTPKATRREWAGLAIIALPCMLYSMDLSVLNLAVPSISAELQPTSLQLLWIVDIYGFLLAGFLIPMGALGDRIGRRRLLLIGAAAFGAASVLAALSSSITMLITARALLGVAGATLAPSTLSLIRNMFLDSDQRTFAIGIWTTSYMVGGAAGPLIGGLLLQYFGWGSVFLIAVPVMSLLLMLGPVLLPEFKNSTAPRIDLISAVQSLAAVLLVIYGFKQIAAYGWQWPAVAAIVFGAIVGIAFVHRQHRLESPLIDLHLLQTTAFAMALLAYTLACFVAFGISLFTAQYIQLVLGFSPLRAVLWMLPVTLAVIAGTLMAPAVVRRILPTQAMSAGLMVTAVGLAMITKVDENSGVEILMAASLVFSLGLAPVIVSAINVMVGEVRPERAGEASAISETGSELGAALGIAVLGSIGASIYRNVIAGKIPEGTEHEASQVAQDTLGGAFAAVRHLPEEIQIPLLDAARTAFVDGFHVVAVLSTSITVAMAVAILIQSRFSPSAMPKVYQPERIDESGG